MHTAMPLHIDLSSYQAFIFDLDNTLLDSEKYHVRALGKALRELAGYELSENDKEEFNGSTSFSLAQSLNRQHDLGLDPHEVTRRKFEILYEDYRSEPYPGAVEFLRAWHGKSHFAIASNSPREFVATALAQLCILDWFPIIVTVDDVKERKPDPEMYRLAIRKLDLQPHECVIFEDSGPGLEAAVSAGCQVLLMDNPGNCLPQAIPPDIPVVQWDMLPLPDTVSIEQQEQSTLK